MKNIVLTCLLFITFTCFSQDKENITILNYKKFKENVVGKKVQLIDLRTDEEYKAGFIDKAIQMNFLEIKLFEKQVKLLDKNKPVYIYCHSGGRSSRAAKFLMEKGFKKIYDFSEGYKSWIKKNKR